VSGHAPLHIEDLRADPKMMARNLSWSPDTGIIYFNVFFVGQVFLTANGTNGK